MERLQLTAAEQAQVDQWLAANVVQTDPIVDGTNLVQFDDIQVDGQHLMRILGGDGSTGTWVYIPAWANPEYWDMPVLDMVLTDLITDRAGPNGETMPIYSELQLQAMAAKASANPQQAAKDERTHRRLVERRTRTAIAQIDDGAERAAVTKHLRALGVLGSDSSKD